MNDTPEFEKFPTADEFAAIAGITPEQASAVLARIAEAVGTDYGVSRDGAWMAAIAIKSGLKWERVLAVFGSWYGQFKIDKDAAEKGFNGGSE